MREFTRRPHYRAYLLRFWEEPRDDPALRGTWRFSLEDPTTRQQRGFADLAALMHFLSVETGKTAGQP